MSCISKMFCCYELWLGLLILKYLHLGIQADVKIDKYEYDGKTVVPKHVTGCQDEKTGILLRAIRISKKSNEIALLPYDITNTDHLELWIEFTNRCNGKRQCQMNQMKLLKNMFDIVLLSPETNTTIETEFVYGDNVYRIATNFKQVINKVGSSSVYLMYNKTSENKVVCHVIADTKFVTVEILHFEWIPSDCKNSKDRISVYRHDFDCSWTKGKKAVTVQQPHNITIELLKQSGFVWLEVQTEVADGRTTQLNLTCDLENLLEPFKTVPVSTRKSSIATMATLVAITTIPMRTSAFITKTSRRVSVNTEKTRTTSSTTNTSRHFVTMSNSGSKQDVANFNDQCLPVIITLCVLLTIAVSVIIFLTYRLKKRNRRSSINVYSTTKGSNQDNHLYNDTVDLNQYETVKEASPNTYNNQLSNVLI
ncbi:uncharacterized protein LOC129926821 isoform X2 [Biomphalaria glabrata]|uniref:Uncharacterized protein LOC129926821 isoform X2 n=1 Tax=Biomphalaria glabrata TaxID=6526 RepID=A0A9W3APF2_BIOGL|nr:uncharacterized protein LOC129926821 isoform X2 [Biomphalaria glabrata]